MFLSEDHGFCIFSENSTNTFQQFRAHPILCIQVCFVAFDVCLSVCLLYLFVGVLWGICVFVWLFVFCNSQSKVVLVL